MRYTTIIDISQSRELYKNINIRLVYLHLVLKSGYHDYDRDIIDISIRNLAQQVGISVAATRHAINMLIKFKMLFKKDKMYYVRKFFIEQTITPRIKSDRQEKAIRANKIRQEENTQMLKEITDRQTRMQKIYDTGKTPYMLYVEALMKKANEGDLEAAEAVKRHLPDYEEHKRKMDCNLQSK